MSKGNKHLITNKSFNDYVFSVMLKSNAEQRKGLSNAELLHFKSNSTKRSFADKASREKKEIMLAKLGYDYTYFISAGPQELEDCIFVTFDQYHTPEKRLNVIEAMAGKGIFAYGSREMQAILSMCAQNAQTKAYQYSLITRRMVKDRKRWNKSETALNGENAQETYQRFAHLIRTAVTSLNSVAGLWDVTALEMRIIMELYQNVASALKASDIINRLLENETPKKVLDALDNLIENEHVINDRKRGAIKKAPGQNIYYILQKSGIKIAMEYIASVAEKINP